MVTPKEDKCTGCRACEKVCPVKCISFVSNKNGFLVPQIEQQKCIKCGMCERTCPIKNKVEQHNVLHVYAAYSSDEKSINSTSGGLFYVLASDIISKGGIVFGAAYDEKMYLKIKEVTTQSELIALQGSKYVQADTLNTYKRVQSYLEQGKKVLYSGTPCQIAGLRNVLGKINSEDLITVEIICHGVPSPKMFRDYIEWFEARAGKRIVDYHFRTKQARNRDFRCQIKYDDGTDDIVSGFKDPFYKKFMSGDCYREICYECPFAQKYRVADITLGDFWNIEDVDIHFGEGNRVSLVLLNSKVGVNEWEEIDKRVIKKEVSWEVAVRGNSNLQYASCKPANYSPYGLVSCTKEYFDENLFIKRNIKKEIFNMLPVMMRKRIKKFF